MGGRTSRLRNNKEDDRYIERDVARVNPKAQMRKLYLAWSSVMWFGCLTGQGDVISKVVVSICKEQLHPSYTASNQRDIEATKRFMESCSCLYTLTWLVYRLSSGYFQYKVSQ